MNPVPAMGASRPLKPILHLPDERFLPGVTALILRGEDLQLSQLDRFYRSDENRKTLGEYRATIQDKADYTLADLANMKLEKWMELSVSSPAFQHQMDCFFKARSSLEMKIIKDKLDDPSRLDSHREPFKKLLLASQDIRNVTRHLPALGKQIDKTWLTVKGDHFPGKAHRDDCSELFVDMDESVFRDREIEANTLPEPLKHWICQEADLKVPFRHDYEKPILGQPKGSVLRQILTEQLAESLGLKPAAHFLKFVPSEIADPVVVERGFNDSLFGLGLQHGKPPHLIQLSAMAKNGLLTRELLNFVMEIGGWDGCFDRSAYKHDLLLADEPVATKKGTWVKGFTRGISGANPHNLTRRLYNGELSQALIALRQSPVDIRVNVLKSWFDKDATAETVNAVTDETIRELEVLETCIRDSLFKTLDKIKQYHPDLMQKLGVLEDGELWEGSEELLCVPALNTGNLPSDDPALEVARNAALRSVSKGHRVVAIMPDNTEVETNRHDVIMKAKGFVIYKSYEPEPSKGL